MYPYAVAPDTRPNCRQQWGWFVELSTWRARRSGGSPPTTADCPRLRGSRSSLYYPSPRASDLDLALAKSSLANWLSLAESKTSATGSHNLLWVTEFLNLLRPLCHLHTQRPAYPRNWNCARSCVVSTASPGPIPGLHRPRRKMPGRDSTLQVTESGHGWNLGKGQGLWNLVLWWWQCYWFRKKNFTKRKCKVVGKNGKLFKKKRGHFQSSHRARNDTVAGLGEGKVRSLLVFANQGEPGFSQHPNSVTRDRRPHHSSYYPITLRHSRDQVR